MKNTMLKRSLSLLLALVLVTALFAGCGKKPKDDPEVLSEFVYVPTFVQFPEEITELRNVTVIDDVVYFTADVAMKPDGTIATQEEIEASYNNPTGGADKPIEARSNMATSFVGGGSVTVGGITGSEEVFTENLGLTYTTALFSVKMDGTDYKRLPDYVEPVAPEGGSSNLQKMSAGADGSIWVLETTNRQIFDLPADFNPATQDKWEYYKTDESSTAIRKLSNTGKELLTVKLDDMIDMTKFSPETGGFNVQDMHSDKQGNLIFGENQGTIYVLNSEGVMQFNVKTDDGWFNSFVGMKNGGVGVSSYDKQGGNIIKLVDVAAKSWGEEIKAPANIWNTSSGGNSYDFCYTDSSSLFGFDATTQTVTNILSWVNSDVNADSMEYSTILENGDVFAITQNYSEGRGNFEVITLKKTPRSEIASKKIITMATMWLDGSIRNQILKFNKTNPEYRVEIHDYSEYNTEKDYTAGLTKLNTEIISGKIPDLIQTDSLPWQQYAAKGLLEDLYPHIDKSTTLKREDFIPNILKAMETDGKLYQMASGFSVQSILAMPKVVGSEMGWTIQELQQIIKDNPQADVPFGQHMTRDAIFQYLCMLNIGEYMNWQTGECSFDTDAFKGLLEFANGFPKAQSEGGDGEMWIGPETLIPEGRQLFEISGVHSIDTNIQYQLANFGGEATFMGFPCADKKGNIATMQGGLAITTSCEYKDGAFEFLSTLVSDEMQESQWSIPMTQKALDFKFKEAMKQEYTTDENGKKVPVSQGTVQYEGGESIEIYAMTQAQADQIKAVIASVEKVAVNNEGLMNIINEEAAAYFAGDKSVDVVASNIQSRMSIYINEQR